MSHADYLRCQVKEMSYTEIKPKMWHLCTGMTQISLASAQSVQSYHCAIRAQAIFMQTVKTLIRMGAKATLLVFLLYGSNGVIWKTYPKDSWWGQGMHLSSNFICRSSQALKLSNISGRKCIHIFVPEIIVNSFLQGHKPTFLTAKYEYFTTCLS